MTMMRMMMTTITMMMRMMTIMMMVINGLAITVIASVDYAGSADFADSASSADAPKRGIAKTKKKKRNIEDCRPEVQKLAF
jgi:hypothetical protein